MDLGGVARSHDIQEPDQETVILLDTNALLWLQAHNRRATPLLRARGSLYVSPASLLEIEILTESGRLRWHGGALPLRLGRSGAVIHVARQHEEEVGQTIDVAQQHSVGGRCQRDDSAF